ncbi:hypothetical protein H6F76_16430 [Leptolyngbya sp. FACHB-321]|uniref:hypothetical protein n=1 Tax=Leptolyngbya sp. FACHB-321 TaxID=2692807 RepID=UPI001689C9DC|nr:hypothetical protein [Leptolyngbya sp. FACHB-321]MBD2036599.1 hypothetical protein [Leptolyngbya sp. FACHB-321]
MTGVSTRYIGACEGNLNFDRADIADLGINTYRLYGGMSRWEREDDDGAYGLPTIAQIKANPDVIPWEQWDAVMTNPVGGSDYAFSGTPAELWQGSARTIFETLKQNHIRPVLTIRNSDPGWGPNWALQLNPPRTKDDWNEWWEHVFATAYWLNVRNDYHVDDFEIHNEPDNRQQGWGGNQADYFELVRVAADAITYVYRTYLPERQFHIHAPKTIGGSQWPADTLKTVPAYFDTINVHNYDRDISLYVRRVRTWMRGTVHARSPLWLGEWGTYTGGYNSLNFSLNLIKNMIRASQPGDTYVYGSHIFSLYGWGRNSDFEGLIDADGRRRLSYYAFRMATRALQGGRTVLLSTPTSSDTLTITTRDETGNVYVLLVNDQNSPHQITIDVSQLNLSPEYTLWEFSKSAHDVVVAHPQLNEGKASFSSSAQSAYLLQLTSNT